MSDRSMYTCVWSNRISYVPWIVKYVASVISKYCLGITLVTGKRWKEYRALEQNIALLYV
jgi:hypothetical protein